MEQDLVRAVMVESLQLGPTEKKTFQQLQTEGGVVKFLDDFFNASCVLSCRFVKLESENENHIEAVRTTLHAVMHKR